MSAKLCSLEEPVFQVWTARRDSETGKGPVTILLILGFSLMLVAPLLRRYKLASHALVLGAFSIIALALIGMAHPDPRYGQAAIASDRRFYLLFLACELPVLALALISLRYFRWTFWLGWAINLALALYLAVIVIWLEFFWHW